MAIVSNIGLVDTLRQTRLLTPAQIDALKRQVPGRRVDSRLLARTMLQHGWLTVYQINQLLAGNGHELIVGPYQILDRLGKGGQSTVYMARRTETGAVVALKVVQADLLTTPEICRQFVQEMEAMSTLHHPNVVRFLDADRHNDCYYCAQEYVAGTDLGKYVRLLGGVPAAEASDYIRQVALGLQHAHERNLIHRDIKPGNLLLTTPCKKKTAPLFGTGSVVKILDWGLASLTRPGQAQRSAESAEPCKVLIGTADYLSPEQALRPDSVDIRSDIYSLGCTFFYLLTGQPPFPDGTVMQKVLKHQNEVARRVDEYRPDLPMGLAYIVQRMLAKQPEDRFQTPGSLAVALTPYCNVERFLLPRLNREIRRRLGLDETDTAPSMAPIKAEECSTFGPHRKPGTVGLPDTAL